MKLPLKKEQIEIIIEYFLFHHAVGEFNDSKNRKKWCKKFNRQYSHKFLTMKADEKMNTPKVIDNNSLACQLSHFGGKYDILVLPEGIYIKEILK